MPDRLASFSRFDEPIPEPAAVCDCAKCREPIAVGDAVMRIDDGDGYVHEDCAAAYAMERVFDAEGVMLVDGTIE